MCYLVGAGPPVFVFGSIATTWCRKRRRRRPPCSHFCAATGHNAAADFRPPPRAQSQPVRVFDLTVKAEPAAVEMQFTIDADPVFSSIIAAEFPRDADRGVRSIIAAASLKPAKGCFANGVKAGDRIRRLYRRIQSSQGRLVLGGYARPRRSWPGDRNVRPIAASGRRGDLARACTIRYSA
jgi:hypothetical protein